MALTGYSLPDTLTDDAGNTLKNVTVTVTGPSAYSGTATSDASTGILRLGPLPVGDYTITLGSRSIVLPVVPSAADVQAAFDNAEDALATADGLASSVALKLDATVASSTYAATAEDETITGEWTFDTPPLGIEAGGASAFDGAVENLNGVIAPVPSGIAKLMLGVLGDDLYIFGNADSADATLEGVRRIKGSDPETVEVLTSTVTAGTHQFSGLNGWPGAVTFRDKLYVGSTSAGRLTRLDLTAGGAFSALTLMNIAAGGEDAWPVASLWGRLYVVGYGAPSSGGPGVYRWDGVAATSTLVKKFTTLGDGSEVMGVAVLDGQLYVSVKDNAAGYELWVIDRDDTATLIDSHATRWFTIAAWGDDLVGTRGDVASPLQLWHDGAWVDLSTANAPGNQALVPMGDELYLFDYYSGVYRYRHGDFDQVWTGVADAQQHYGMMSPVVWGDKLCWTTQQGRQGLWALALGTGHAFRSLAAHQKSAGGWLLPRLLRRANAWRKTQGFRVASGNAIEVQRDSDGALLAWISNAGMFSLEADTGATGLHIASSGAAINDNGGVAPLASLSSAGLGAAKTPLVLRSADSATADILELRSGSTRRASINGAGVYVSDVATAGIVLKSPDGHFWRQTVSNAGATVWTDLGTTRPST